MEQKKVIDMWRSTASGTVKVDWASVENAVGFGLHTNFKDLYSRIRAEVDDEDSDGFTVMKFHPDEFVKEYVGDKNGWLDDANNGREFCQFELNLPCVDDNMCAFVKEAFKGAWTGGNDFGHRAMIGELLLNIGQIYLIFNNDTGRFEWVDFGYGYYDVYEENPYGVIADTAQEFLDKFDVV